MSYITSIMRINTLKTRNIFVMVQLFMIIYVIVPIYDGVIEYGFTNV